MIEAADATPNDSTHDTPGACCTAGFQSPQCPLWVMCGRRLIDKSFFDVAAALVGCGHVSGLLMRHGWPLALMLCADQVPIHRTHSKMR